MAKNKPKRLSGQELKDINRDISKLRKLGLYKGKAARGQPTDYAKKLVKKFDAAINGLATVVTVPRKAVKDLADKIGDLGIFKGNKAVIETNALSGERARYSKKSNEINVTGVDEYGRTYRKTVSRVEKKPPPRKGETREFRFNFPPQRKRNGRMGKRGTTPWSDSLDELLKIGAYDKKWNSFSETYRKQILEIRDIKHVESHTSGDGNVGTNTRAKTSGTKKETGQSKKGRKPGGKKASA